MYSRLLASREVSTSGTISALNRRQEAGSIGRRDCWLEYDATNGMSYSGTGTAVTDISPSGFTGTLTNGATYSSESGGMFSLDGTNDYITAAHNAAQNPSSITMLVWARPSSGWSTGGCFIGKGGDSGYRIRFNATFAIQWLDRGLTNNLTIGAATTRTGRFRWAHIACTGSPSGLRTYTYGILRGSNTTAFAGNVTTSPFQVGTVGLTGATGEMFNGNISSVLMFSRELSSAEIYQHYLSTKWRYNL